MRFVKGYRGVDGSIQPRLGVPRYSGYQDHVIRDQFFDDTGDHFSGIPPPEYRGDPIHLSGSVLVISGSQSVVNPDALRNTLNVPIEVHEIKITAVAASQLVFCEAIIALRLSLKTSKNDEGIFLSQTTIPIGLLSGATHAENPLASELGFNGQTVNFASNSYTNITVRLPRPIILPPGAYIEPVVQHLGQVSSSVTVRVSLSGRTMGKGVRREGPLTVPYFTFFSTTPQLGVASTALSTEKDLVNPFSDILHVERLVGRISIFTSAFGGITTQTASENVEVFGFDGNSVTSLTLNQNSTDLIQVSMWSSDGYPVIAPSTPFRLAFDYFTREWAVDFDLDPGGYLITQIDSLAPSAQYGAPADNKPISVGIGLVGWREIAP